MNWAQENKKLAGIVGVMVVGGLGLGVWLYLSWSGYSGAMEQWDQTQARINTLRAKKPTPTADNVAKRDKHLSEYADKVNQLRGALLAVQQGTKPISETEFQARLKDIAAEMKRLAKAAGVKDLPDDFALGFDKYSSQPPRSPEIAAELNVHLDAMQKLVTACIEAGVTSIDMLDRTKLENEDAPVPTKAAPVVKPKAGAASAARKAKGVKKPVITEQAAAEPVLDRYPIKLLITTDQGPFQNLVNTLCHPGKMPYFMVLRLVRIENSRTDGPTKDEINQRRTSAAQSASPENAAPKPAAEPPKPGAAAAPAAQVITPPRPATPDAFDIMGREQLKVYLEIDYIRFRPAPKIEDEETSSDTPAPAGAPAAAPAPAAPAPAPAKS
jgi:hypothetical protein